MVCDYVLKIQRIMNKNNSYTDNLTNVYPSMVTTPYDI